MRKRWAPRSPWPNGDFGWSRGEEPLDHPSARLDGEADLISLGLHDFDGNARGVCNSVAGIAAVGENLGDERQQAMRSLKQRAAAIAILDVGRMLFGNQAPPISINQGTALATFYL